MYVTDTFRVTVETVRIDTPSTKNLPHLLIGEYNDPTFGNVNATSFSQLALVYTNLTDDLNADTLFFGSDAVFDSVSFYLNSDFYLGDTTLNPVLSFSVYHLSETIDSTKAHDYKYTSPKLGMESTPLVTFDQFHFNQSSTGKVSFYGSDAAQVASTFSAYEGTSRQDFLTKFNGLAFVPNAGNTYMLGVRAGSASSFSISLYFHNVSDASLKYYTFAILNNSTDTSYCQRFTALDHTPPQHGQPMASFPPGIASVSSSDPTMLNMGFMNDMLGIRTRISFPTIPAFLEQIKGQYNLLEASIIIPPADSTYTFDVYRQPTPYLKLFECDENGVPLKRNTENADGSYYEIVQNETYNTFYLGNLNDSLNNYYSPYDYLNYKRFYYPFTLYMKDIGKGIKPNHPFIASLNSYFSTGTYAPLGYTFYDRSRERGIKLIVYLNK